MPPKGDWIRVIETGKIYRGTRAVAEAINGDFSAVAECLRAAGGRYTHKGFTFEHVDKEED